MRILGYCLLAAFFAAWPLIDNAFLSPTRSPTAVETEAGADWIGAGDHPSIAD